MKTSIVLFSLCALTMIAVGAGLGPADTAAPALRAPAAMPAVAEATAHTTGANTRTVPMKVMPTITVLASSADFDRADESADTGRSVMFDAAVDSAGDAIVQPLRAALPRARPGNPFYDFSRRNSVRAVTE